jgi:PAS domain S-box-containing protein
MGRDVYGSETIARSPIVTYGLTIAAVAVAGLARWLLEPVLGEHLPLFTLYFATIFSAWFGGFWPGMASVAFGMACAVFFFIEPRFDFAISGEVHRYDLIRYAGVALFFSGITEALHRSRTRSDRRREHLRTTLACIGDAVITTNTEGRVTMMNGVAESLTGWKRDEAAGQPIVTVFNIVNETTRKAVNNPVVMALKEGVIVGLEKHTILIAKDGTERPIDDSAAPIRDSNGVMFGCVLVFRDITERYQADEALHRNEERFRLAADAVNGIIYDADLLTGHVERTRGLYEVLGYRPEEVPPTGAWWIEQIHPDDRERITRFDPIIAREATAAIEYQVRHRDGRWLHVEDRAVLVWDAGRAVRLVGCTTDITARKDAEETLRFQLDLTKSITDNATTAIFMMDDKSRCTFMNPAAEQITGFTFKEVKGGFLHDFIHHHADGRPYPMPESPIDRALPEGGEVRDHEDVFFRKNGEKFPVMCNARVIHKDGVPVGTVIEVRDVTSEKEAADALRLLAANLSEANRRKDEFLATLAHELRNPLAPIRNGLQVMKLAGNDADAAEEARSMMERQLEQMVRLVDDLMDVSRISRNKIELRRQRMQLAAAVGSAVEATRPIIDQMGHELTVTLPKHPVIVDADSTRLAQVFMNLLNNAAKYSDRGGHIWLTVERQGSDAVVSVRDTGIGIDAHHLPRLFDLFSQVDRSLEKAQGGLGIGLHLVKRLVEMHGGRIEAHSDGPGRGSEFVVRLPIVVEASAPPAEPEEPTAPTSALRLLIVDDNKDGADSLAMMLKIMGNETHTAYDGQEGVEMAMHYRPDVALFDIGLPKLNGYEACRRIRKQPGGNDIILIAVTGWGQDEDRRRSHEAGFDHHMIKPVDPTVLMKLLAELNVVKK